MMVNAGGDVGEKRRMKASYHGKVIEYFKLLREEAQPAAPLSGGVQQAVVKLRTASYSLLR
jgi:ABC-type branched-subunit amino acid transport system ATPase component